MDPNWNTWLERGRALQGAPPLRRDEKASGTDPKWGWGDLLSEVPEHLIDRFAGELGSPTGSELRRYRDVALCWPKDRRVAASWSAHRDLKDHPHRFDLIHPGMTVREAAAAAGKKPIDAKPVERMSLDERAEHVLIVLGDKRVNDLVLTKLHERTVVRRIHRAAQAAADDRSAEYKQAMKSLRQAQAAKSPESAFIEVVFKIQEAAEYLRAVLNAATMSDGPSLVPEHRKPDLVLVIESLRTVADTALDALTDRPRTRAEPINSRTFIDVPERKPRPELLEPPSW